ncbi:MAG TPA: TRAP transporter permease [Thermohalobaculum sp.]|nr:TRAP transporter permease [Thermohalobaculum sp.]
MAGSDTTREAATDTTASSAGDLVAQIDTGARTPENWQKHLIIGVCFAWSVFQLYFASNVPFWLAEQTGLRSLQVSNIEARRVHLAFALVLAALAYPLFKSSPRDRIPWYDWGLVAAGLAATFYALVFQNQIALRAGLPTTGDLIISSVGMIVLGIAVYRSLGLPLLIVALVFVMYVFFGHSDMLPSVMQWGGASFGKAMWHFWMQEEGVFGVALGVSVSLIFLFVLFGAILEKAGAGNYFIKFAFAVLGHLRGGPAKAAVVASGMSGLYSGSSIANVVTTGTFTIPLMKRTGFSAEKAGAVEVAASTNGQLTPPVMGAAAFLIAEFTGVAYLDIIRHAILPALVSYIALVYIVHLEALKMGLKGLEKPTRAVSLARKLIGFLTGFIGIAALTMAVYYGLGWIKTAMPGAAFQVVLVGLSVAYLGLLWLASRSPDLEMDDPNAPITELPRAWEVGRTGLHFVLPIVVLIWCIVVERLSPALSAFWATLAMVAVALTQHPIKAIMRGEAGALPEAVRRGVNEWFAGMISGARNMIGIGVATGAAGIIVGTVSLTGAHNIVGELVAYLSGGSLIIMLVLVAVMSLILGMGLPTTANYIVVSSLMAPVIVIVGAQQGLVVPLVAVHLFVFYFGILADDTPPVGLAAFAAAAISGGDPIRTGVQGFMYDIRTALLPFIFIFNTDLLLIDVTWFEGILVFVISVVAMMCFAAATQGYFFAPNRLWETAILLLVAFTLFRPGYWLDQIEPPYVVHRGAAAVEAIGALPEGAEVRLLLEGPDFDTGEISSFYVSAPVGGEAGGAERLEAIGLPATPDNGALVLEPLPFGSPFEDKLGRQFDFFGDEPVEIVRAEVASARPPKELFFIPGLIVLALLILWQRRRATQPAF